MLLCRLEAEMAAMDVQRLQQQLQTSQSRLAEESLQRRQLQAELEQVRALSAALGLSSCLSRRLQAQMDQASECELCSCQVATRLQQQSTASCRQCSSRNSKMACVAVQAPRILPGRRCSRFLLWCHTSRLIGPLPKMLLIRRRHLSSNSACRASRDICPRAQAALWEGRPAPSSQ